jgi:hypothetical protein
MSEQLQLRRGTSAQVLAFTGAQGEAVMDTTNNRLVINDGSTAGGFPAAKLSEVITNTRASVSDANYLVASTDRMVAYTALTAARVVSLPASSTYPTGTRLLVVDETGNCSVTKTLSLTPNGTDTIDGVTGAASAVVNEAYGFIGIESNGAGAWTIVDEGFLNSTETVAASPLGATMQFAIIEFLVSGLSGTSVTTSGANVIPANCIVFSVGARVTTAITASGSPTGWQLGTSIGGASQFGGTAPGLGMSAGTVNYGLIGPTGFYAAAPLILAPVGGSSPSFTGGAVRLSIHLAYCNPSAG